MSTLPARVADTLSALFFAGIFGTLTFFGSFLFGDREALPVAEAAMARVFAEERGIAERAGLVAVEDGRATGAATQHAIRLNPGECMSVIVGVAGATGLEPLRIVDARTGRPLEGERSVGTDFVRHMQWCSPLGGSFTLTAQAPTPPRVAILTGVPRRGALPLPRVAPPAAALPALRDELVAATMERGLTAAVVPVTRLTATAPPMLLPSTPATRAALREAMLLGPGADLSTVPLTPAPEGVARRDLADDVAAEEPAPRGRRHRGHTEVAPAAEPAARVEPILHVFGDNARIVAVVDPGALDAGCVALRFVRADAGATPVVRVDVPGWRAEAVAVTDGVARDVLCPAEGLRVYARLEAAPTEPLLFAVESLPARGAARAAPSPWRGESTPHSLVARLEAECERDAQGCLALEDLATVARFRAPRPTATEALRRACERPHAASCGRYGAALLAAQAPDVPRATAAMARGCELGDSLTCAVLAAHERVGDAGVAQDIPSAFAHYGRACALGNAPACAARDTMRLLHLGG